MERNVPKLRFKGFIDEWKLSNLKKLCDINPKSKQLPDKFVYIDLESIIDGVLIKKNIIELKDAPSRAQRLLNVGDVLFQTVRPYQMNNYLFEYELNYKSVASTGYAQLRCKSCISNNKFIYQALHNKKFNNKVMLRCTGTSYPAINSSELVTIPLRIPSLQEQERIANFLTKVDKIIEKQDEKVKNLEKYKKGIMQKIFSQEIRFKDENGEEYPEWEEKKLEQCFLERVEKNKPDLELLSVSISDGVKKRSEIESKDNSSDDKSNYKLVEQNDIVYNSMRMWQGASGVSEYKGIVSPAYTVLIPLDNVNSIYFSYLFKLENTINKFRKFSQGLTSDTWNLKYPLLKDIKVIVPCLNEQDKIARFLTRISLIIEEENNKLEELKQWKKGLLQQMFV